MLHYSKELEDRLQGTIDSSRTNNQPTALLLIALMNADKLRIAYGAEHSNHIISRIVVEITAFSTKFSYVADIDGDYIVVVWTGCDEQEIATVAKQLYSRIQYIRSDSAQEPIHIMTSMSSVIMPADASTAVEALDKAYLANKNSAFDENKFYLPYNRLEDSKKIYKNQFIMADCLKGALLENKLRLAYQPIISSHTGQISHYECLLRIVNNDGKLISVGPFIPIAEEMGFINLIDELVLDMVVQELKNSPTVTLAFNLSTLGVYNDALLEKAQKAFQDSSIATRTIVEITETAAHQELGKAAYFIAALQGMGCRVALDDFGAGHTSFRQLKALPVDIIKIDGAFIRDIVKNPESRLFVNTLITMSKGIGFKSVAEFVENGEIAKLLMELGIDYMQGNYFCPAINYRSWVNYNE